MTYEEVKKLVSGMGRGTRHTIYISRKLQTRKGITDEVIKREATQALLGTSYANNSHVKAQKEAGLLQGENTNAGNYRYLDDKLFFRENLGTGKIVLNCAYAHGNKDEIHYYKNGSEISEAEAKELCVAKAFRDRPQTEWFTPSVETIVDIK